MGFFGTSDSLSGFGTRTGFASSSSSGSGFETEVWSGFTVEFGFLLSEGSKGFAGS